MPSPSAVIRGFVQRALPTSPLSDNANLDVAVRLDPYGAFYNSPLVRKVHNLADEGSYFLANNGTTAVAYTSTIAFSATAPFVVVFNGNTVGGKNIYLDYLNMAAATAGSLTATLSYTAMALVIDTGNRYSSGGTALTPVSPNMNLSNAKSAAVINVGAVTATAASGAARTLCGQRVVRAPVSTTVPDVVGDQFQFNFGGVEGLNGSSITVANASVSPLALPPVVIGPQQSALVYVYMVGGSAATAPTFFPEIGYWER
jgi:hypothetical protein